VHSPDKKTKMKVVYNKHWVYSEKV